MTWLSVYEFFKGIYVSGRIDEEHFLRRLVDSSLMMEESYESSRIGGEIYATLRKTGKMISDADILIASIVKQHKAVLVTNNESHFKRVAGLRLENWLIE